MRASTNLPQSLVFKVLEGSERSDMWTVDVQAVPRFHAASWCVAFPLVLLRRPFNCQYVIISCSEGNVGPRLIRKDPPQPKSVRKNNVHLQLTQRKSSEKRSEPGKQTVPAGV